MSAEVIRFPSASQSQARPKQDIVATALAVHEIIAACLAEGCSTTSERAGLLFARLLKTYGALAPLAEEHFELIYRCDPITFLEHASSYKAV